MARDPASRVISWFAALMAAVILLSVAGTCWSAWELWRLLRAIVWGV